MKLYFARHGESQANTQLIISNRDLPHGLTDKGRQQAAELARKLEGVPFAKIYTSPILRAVQTAEIVARELRPDLEGFEGIETTDALREFDCGEWEGQSLQPHWDDYLRLFQDWQAGQWDSHFPGGESLLDIRARFVPFIERITCEHGEADNVLLVSHGGTLLGLLPTVLTNVDHAFGYSHHLANTDIVVAETRPTGLVCVSWCGQAL
jgi:probable phosphoglycerate mutase